MLRRRAFPNKPNGDVLRVLRAVYLRAFYLSATLIAAQACSLPLPLSCGQEAEGKSTELIVDEVQKGEAQWQRDQWVAWCIVPFDAKKRGPEERAAMLESLGLRRLAYDYRAEHIPTFDAELDALKRHGIELTAWWFPTDMNDEAKLILEVLKRHQVKTQLWVTGGGEPTRSAEEQRARVASEAERIARIARAAAEIGCSVGLYNHGGWFGEPENQIEIIKSLNMPNVGIVYNLHHGHAHLQRLPELLAKMKPYLLTINLNGMIPHGDETGAKILPIGAGSEDESWLKAIRESGYRGPIGILNHTELDAEQRLLDNLEGLEWLLKKSSTTDNIPSPAYRTWNPQQGDLSALDQGTLFKGVLLEGNREYQREPLLVETRARITSTSSYNILVANDRKDSPRHWEIFTMPGSGNLSVYLPGRKPDHVHTNVSISDGEWHQIAFHYESKRAKVLIDGQRVGDLALEGESAVQTPTGLGIGRLVEGGFGCHGDVQWVTIARGSFEENTTLIRWENEAFAAGKNAEQNANEMKDESKVNESSATEGTSVRPFDEVIVKKVVARAKSDGDATAGITVFASNKFACLSCHKIGETGGAVGPSFDQLGKQRTVEQIVESLFWPQRTIEAAYHTQRVLTSSGTVVSGYPVESTAGGISLRDPSTGNVQHIAEDDIEDQQPAGSLMPDGLTDAMRSQQQSDLIAFLSDLGHWERTEPELVQTILSHYATSEPATFDYTLMPLDPENWTQLHQNVNQNRLFQYYTKQAEHFRSEAVMPPLLAEFPGLDGPNFGHWGSQNEAGWADDRWNNTKLGSVQCGIFSGAERVVPKGVCMQLGDGAEMSACFNPETLSYDVIWTGGFLQFSSVRHGFMHGVLLDGTPLPESAVANGASLVAGQPFEYHGYFRYGNRVIFSYRIGATEYLDSPWVESGKFVRQVGPAENHPFKDWIKGGPATWPEEIATEITLGKQQPYAVDTFAIPSDNPWNSLMFIGDHAFLPNGDALLCTMQGDVWRVTETNDAKSEQPVASWRRIAAGLNQPLGMVVSDDGIFVLGRDQITRLHDLNDDGEVDFYESFSRAYETSTSGHDFICGLQRDAAGYFYTASGNQGVVKISPDGSRAEIIATGFRNPDGLGLLPNGIVTVPCSEGEWTPASMICAVRPGSTDNFFGYRGPKNNQPPQLPMLYLPRGVDNSSGGQVYVDSQRWGPFHDQMVHVSYGAGTYMVLLRDEVDGQLQGAVVPMAGDFSSAVHRAHFNPRDGQLYVSGMAGWGTYTTDDGCFARVRYTGAAVQQPIGFHVHENGVMIHFSGDLDRSVAEQTKSHFAQSWNYRYSSAYGSPEYSARHTGLRGHDTMRIASAHVLPDNRSLFLEIPDLQPVNQLHLRMYVNEREGRDLFMAVHKLDQPFTDFEGYRAEEKKIDPHPIWGDLAMVTESVPNPWRNPIDGARAVRVVTAGNLSYETRVVRAKAGEALQLTLVNPDVVPHNWVLVNPGSQREVGELANRLISDPKGVARQYVPESDQVLFYTDVVDSKQEMTISFRAPETPGRYPYMCTFPGHWMVMVGELIVEAE